MLGFLDWAIIFLPELKQIVFFQIYKWHIGKKEAVTEEL
jgi:hypothetical protein